MRESDIFACAFVTTSLFSTAIEAALLTSADHDAATLTFDATFRTTIVERSRYVMARRAGRSILSAITTR